MMGRCVCEFQKEKKEKEKKIYNPRSDVPLPRAAQNECFQTEKDGCRRDTAATAIITRLATRLIAQGLLLTPLL